MCGLTLKAHTFFIWKAIQYIGVMVSGVKSLISNESVLLKFIKSCDIAFYVRKIAKWLLHLLITRFAYFCEYIIISKVLKGVTFGPLTVEGNKLRE